MDHFEDIIKELYECLEKNEREMLEDNKKRKSQINPSNWWQKRDEYNNQLYRCLNNIQKEIGFFYLTLFIPQYENQDFNHEIYEQIKNIFENLEQNNFNQQQQNFVDIYIQDDKKNAIELLGSLLLTLQQNKQPFNNGDTNITKDFLQFTELENQYINYLVVNIQLKQILTQNIEQIIKQVILKQQQKQFQNQPVQPVSILLSENLQFLPFESLPIFEDFQVPMYRLPSITFYMENIGRDNTRNIQNTFYLLDPNNDLNNSQKKLLPKFQQWQNWIGYAGNKIQSQNLCKYTQEKDFYLYAGHGGGETELKTSDLKQMYDLQSVNLLMGCSSAKLINGFRNTNYQYFDNYGYTMEFALSGALLSVGGLSDVTDKDADKLILEILKKIQGLKKKESVQLALLFRQCKKVCRLINTNGSIFVNYGLPINVINS